MEEQKVQAPPPQQIQRIVNINLPVVYANSYQVGLSIADIGITLEINGQPFQLLNVSYNTAKGLGETLLKAVEKYEKETGVKILTGKEATTYLRKEKK